jgi:hypothetical protein
VGESRFRQLSIRPGFSSCNRFASPRFSQGFVARRRRRAWIRRFANRRATEGPAGVLNSTSRSPTERNAVDMPGYAAAAESL